MHGTQRSDRIVAITIAILLTAGCIVVLSPFVSALLWAVILCCVTWPTLLAVEPAAHALGMNSVFVGIFVVAILGNAAEHATAVTAALGNRMELSLGIAVGSSVQIALFVTPVLVLASLGFGPQPMDLVFVPGLVLTVFFAVLVLGQVSGDGQSNWIKGVQLLAVYLILAIVFYFAPGKDTTVSEVRVRETGGWQWSVAGVFRTALHDPVLLAPAHARRGATAQCSGIPCQSPRAVLCHKPARGGGPDRRQEDTAGPADLPGGRISAAGHHGLAQPGGARADVPGALDGGRAARGGQRATFCPGRTGWWTESTSTPGSAPTCSAGFSLVSSTGSSSAPGQARLPYPARGPRAIFHSQRRSTTAS